MEEALRLAFERLGGEHRHDLFSPVRRLIIAHTSKPLRLAIGRTPTPCTRHENCRPPHMALEIHKSRWFRTHRYRRVMLLQQHRQRAEKQNLLLRHSI
jgi:hypothetical protein